MALDVGQGDEVITTPFTFISTAEVIALLGARPVFVDIKEDTYNIDPEKVADAISDRTTAIIPVDIFGQCADYKSLGEISRRHNIPLIEDAAQSFGAMQNGSKAGGFGEIGCTSFYPAKPLGCYGDGGMVFTNSYALAEKIRSLRVHGEGERRYEHVQVGLNARLDAIQAAVLLGKFPKFEWEIEQRQRIAQRYSEKLDTPDIIIPTVLAGNTSAWAQYCIRVPNRDATCKRLNHAGIPTSVFYPIPLHLQKAFAYLDYEEGDLPVSERVSRDIMALPMHPYLNEETQDRIIGEVKEAVGKAEKIGKKC
jgi:UDP-2-acetamido-2-deoxy-ribo-hexuluronate aminotransferase